MSSRRRWSLLILGLAAVTLVTGWVVNQQLINRNIEQASQNMLLLSDLRRQALERYFETAEAELRFWAAREDLIQQQEWLNAEWVRAVAEGKNPEQRLQNYYIENNPYPLGERRKLNERADLDTPYLALHAALHPLARKFVEQRGYYDFLLISPVGNIHYTVEKEKDFGTNLHTGPFKDTGLAGVFKRALQYAQSDDVAVSDLVYYEPSDGPAMFMAKAMYGSQGELVGVLALQIPTERIVEIMNFRGGMGATGETYLVGEDLLMRSNSRFSQESTILKQKVDTLHAHRALRGEQGVGVELDYRGQAVLSAYSSAIIDESTWAVLAEIDQAEILQRATSDRPLLAGFMLFFYSLALWSVWFVQRADDALDSAPLLGDMDGGFDTGDG
jgi:methyl-accepting chemotaxis protein